MKLSVIGVGYLGAVHAAAMASLGFEVVGVDVDLAKLDALRAGKAPFYEPGFDELLAQVMPTGRLTWTDDFAAIDDADVHFVCVGTPQKAGAHSADLRHVWAAVESMIPHLRAGSVVAGKSTVPVGTAAEIDQRIRSAGVAGGASGGAAAGGESVGPAVVWNPEFLRRDSRSPTPCIPIESWSACRREWLGSALRR